MLKIHFSNRYELLTDLLVGQLAQARGNAFAPDQIIVPSAAVRRSLTLSLAEQRGICANVQFDYLAQWLWQQMARLLPDVADKSPLAPSHAPRHRYHWGRTRCDSAPRASANRNPHENADTCAR